MLENSRICINRKSCPGLGLADFIRLCGELGVHHVELRNDLYAVDGNNGILDGEKPEVVNKFLKKYDVQVEDINSVGNTDDPSQLDANLKLLDRMIGIAKSVGAKKILFCPVMDKNDSRSDEEKFNDGVKTVKAFSERLAKEGMSGLFETLGFPESSIRTPFRAMEIIKAAGADNFKVVADLFHWFMGGVTFEDMNNKLDVNDVGLIHISSVTSELPKAELNDQMRFLLASPDDDRVDALEKVDWFKQHGYAGLYSFEGFSDKLRDMDFATAKKELGHSAYLIK